MGIPPLPSMGMNVPTLGQPSQPPSVLASLVGRMVGQPASDDGPGVMTTETGEHYQLGMVVSVGAAPDKSSAGWRWPVLVLLHDGELGTWWTGTGLRVVQVQP